MKHLNVRWNNSSQSLAKDEPKKNKKKDIMDDNYEGIKSIIMRKLKLTSYIENA